jgi:hypothetical protein
MKRWGSGSFSLRCCSLQRRQYSGRCVRESSAAALSISNHATPIRLAPPGRDIVFMGTTMPLDRRRPNLGAIRGLYGLKRFGLLAVLNGGPRTREKCLPVRLRRTQIRAKRRVLINPLLVPPSNPRPSSMGRCSDHPPTFPYTLRMETSSTRRGRRGSNDSSPFSRASRRVPTTGCPFATTGIHGLSQGDLEACSRLALGWHLVP